jgi:hypothetical protein
MTTAVASATETTSMTDWQWLRRPALLGFLAMVAIAGGASFPDSPFKLEITGSWFFGVPSASNSGALQPTAYVLIGLVAVFGGMFVLLRVWCGLLRALAHRPGVPVKYLVLMMALWVVPLLLVAPLFSRDVFSYAAQGEMVSRHINPYTYGPFTLGTGPYVNPVDPLWGNTPAPYGPLFMIVDGFFASVSLHHELFTVLLLRLLALVGVGLCAYCIPKLAQSFGRDRGRTFALALLNPVVLLALIGGVHNDAIMIGLVVAGVTAARLKHPVWGIALCGLAAAIKVPAAMGIVFVAWEWSGHGVPWRQRVRPLAAALGISGLVMFVITGVSGLGWGWIKNLGTPTAAANFFTPTNTFGSLATRALHSVGLHLHEANVVAVFRLGGLLVAGAGALYLLLNSDRIGMVKALGLSMVLFVWLGPVVQPWYVTWGVLVLAPVATGHLRTLVIWLSVLAPFIDLTGGRYLLSQLLQSDPLAALGAIVVLALALTAPLGRWAHWWSSDWRNGPLSLTAMMGTPAEHFDEEAQTAPLVLSTASRTATPPR